MTTTLATVLTRDGSALRIRLATEEDVPPVRRLVNAAYAELAGQGLNYTGTYQDEATTRERMAAGRTFVLVDASDTIIGTITLEERSALSPSRCAHVGQLGVSPQLKRQGLGSKLMDFVEALAHGEGHERIRLDTAKPAEHLVRWYLSRGYRIAGEERFEGKTYESWIFEKNLGLIPGVKKHILMIGLLPEVVDLSSFPGLTPEKLAAALAREEQSLRDIGFDARWCLTDLGETAEAVARAALDEKPWDVVLIGAGVRTVPAYFLLFEKLINVVHLHAPRAKLCFNTRPDDTREAVLRWVEAPSQAQKT